MSASKQELPEGREPFTECETESVEEVYNSGSLQNILVMARWRRGNRLIDESVDDEWIDKQVTGKAEYTVRDGEARLTGFYPECHGTGRELYRDTLKALRVLPHCWNVVQGRVPEDVEVKAPSGTIYEKIEDGNDAVAE